MPLSSQSNQRKQRKLRQSKQQKPASNTTKQHVSANPEQLTQHYVEPSYSYCCVHQRGQYGPHPTIHSINQPIQLNNVPHHYHDYHPTYYQPILPSNHHIYPHQAMAHPPCCNGYHAHLIPTHPYHQCAPAQFTQQVHEPHKPMIAWSHPNEPVPNVNPSSQMQPQNIQHPTDQLSQQGVVEPAPQPKSKPSAMIYPSWWPNETETLTSEDIHKDRLARQRQMRMSQHQQEMRKSTNVASHYCPPSTMKRSQSATTKSARQKENTASDRDQSINILASSMRSTQMSSKSHPIDDIPRTVSSPIHRRTSSKETVSRISSLIERDKRDYRDRSVLQSQHRQPDVTTHYNSTADRAAESQTLVALVQQLSVDNVVRSFM